MSKQKAIIVSGYFNPIHKGHLEYFNNAKTILSIYTHRTVCATIKMIAEEFVEEFELYLQMEVIKTMTLFQRGLFAKR